MSSTCDSKRSTSFSDGSLSESSFVHLDEEHSASSKSMDLSGDVSLVVESSFLDLRRQQSRQHRAAILSNVDVLCTEVKTLDLQQQDTRMTATKISTDDVSIRSDVFSSSYRSQRPVSCSPIFHRPPHGRSLSQDDYFLGTLPGVSMPAHDGEPSDAEQVVVLKEQLADTIMALESLRSEVCELKQRIVSTGDAHVYSEDANNVKVLTCPSETERPSTADTLYTKLDREIVSLVDDSLPTEEYQNQHDLSKKSLHHRTATLLPSPGDPSAVSAYLNGQFRRVAQESDYAGLACSDVATERFSEGLSLERRLSEPDANAQYSATVLAHPLHDNAHDQLTFFPGTSNTPSRPFEVTRPTEQTDIWKYRSFEVNAHLEPLDDSEQLEHMQDRPEHISYRRIMDRNSDVNWSIIVNKVVHANDQHASVALQQKIKIAPTEQKIAIIDAVILQAFALMINRFGNFLIQRCFEHGTPEQIIMLGNAIKGNVLTLSKDAFGCHVVQKAFDNVPDALKVEYVAELLTQIKETVTHRYACHVWQKLFEVRWVEKAPEIMSFVNNELVGSWTRVALGETGSLVVQNIFENCTEHERRPCIEEILCNVSTIIKGQWGNWVIQHIVEHGAPHDHERAIDAVMQHAVEYSMDQYASKVIERAIKSGDLAILGKYLDTIMQAKANDQTRPRMPLIDIASDQYGNYLIQYILTHGNVEQRGLVAAQIRKHMVSMRGSRYGAKVAFTVEKMRYGMYEHGNYKDFRPSYVNKSRSFHGNSSRGHHR